MRRALAALVTVVLSAVMVVVAATAAYAVCYQGRHYGYHPYFYSPTASIWHYGDHNYRYGPQCGSHQDLRHWH